MAYSMLDYGSMLRASPRVDAYVEVLRRYVTPSSLVVDLGAGFGFFSVLAAKLGAKHVVAVDPCEELAFGAKLARANGVADRITWVNGKIEDAQLPRPADLIVADLRGIIPMHSGHFDAIRAARALLAPAGRLVPMKDTLFCAAVGDDKPFDQWLHPWTDASGGVSLEPLREVIVNRWGRGRCEPAQLLGAPRAWATIDYATIETGRVAGKASLVVERAGPLCGLAVWFDTELAPGVGFSNAPGAPHSIYANAMMPLLRAVELDAGASVDVEIAATPINDDWDWQWHVVARSKDGAVLAEERHHTMLARPLAVLAKKAADTP